MRIRKITEIKGENNNRDKKGENNKNNEIDNKFRRDYNI